MINMTELDSVFIALRGYKQFINLNKLNSFFPSLFGRNKEKAEREDFVVEKNDFFFP